MFKQRGKLNKNICIRIQFNYLNSSEKSTAFQCFKLQVFLNENLIIQLLSNVFIRVTLQVCKYIITIRLIPLDYNSSFEF